MNNKIDVGLAALALVALTASVRAEATGEQSDLEIMIDFDGNTPSDVAVSITGQREVEIHKSDLQALGLKSSDLKNGLKAIFGKKPDEVSLGYGDEYADNFDNNGKHPATAHINSAEVSWQVGEIVSKTEVANSTYAVNCTGDESTSSVAVGVGVEESISESWSRSYTVGVSFSVSAGYGSLGASAEVSASTTVGESSTATKTNSSWAELSQDVTLAPWQCKLAQLEITRVTVPVEFTFDTHLKGDVLGHYKGGYNPPDYGGGSAIYWFSSFDSVVAQSSQQPPDYEYVMTVNIDYPTDGQMIIYEIDCNDVPDYEPASCGAPSTQ